MLSPGALQQQESLDKLRLAQAPLALLEPQLCLDKLLAAQPAKDLHDKRQPSAASHPTGIILTLEDEWQDAANLVQRRWLRCTSAATQLAPARAAAERQQTPHRHARCPVLTGSKKKSLCMTISLDG